MRNPIGKMKRYFEREYPYRGTVAGVTAVTAIGLGAITAPLGLAAIVPLFVGAAFVDMETPDRCADNYLDLNGYRFVGSARDLSSIKMTQELIDRKTKKLEHLPALPQKLQREIAAHVEDIQSAMRSVKMYEFEKLKSTDSFEFRRDCFNEKGKLITQRMKVADILRLVPSEPVVLPPPPQYPSKALPAPNSVAPDFSRLAKKVDELQAELDAVKNPHSIDLNNLGKKHD